MMLAFSLNSAIIFCVTASLCYFYLAFYFSMSVKELMRPSYIFKPLIICISAKNLQYVCVHYFVS